LADSDLSFKIKFMKQLTKEQLKEYLDDPMKCDSKIRKWCDIPDNRYYTVMIYPEKVSGRVEINMNMTRTVPVNKISKSDQK
jgi:hypothetical protein